MIVNWRIHPSLNYVCCVFILIFLLNFGESRAAVYNVDGVSSPTIEVYDGLELLQNGVSVVDFGSVPSGQSHLPTTFTVVNTSDSDLIINNLTVPVGYTVTESLNPVINVCTGSLCFALGVKTGRSEH